MMLLAFIDIKDPSKNLANANMKSQVEYSAPRSACAQCTVKAPELAARTDHDMAIESARVLLQLDGASRVRSDWRQHLCLLTERLYLNVQFLCFL
jgi:hypothetical protein